MTKTGKFKRACYPSALYAMKLIGVNHDWIWSRLPRCGMPDLPAMQRTFAAWCALNLGCRLTWLNNALGVPNAVIENKQNNRMNFQEHANSCTCKWESFSLFAGKPKRGFCRHNSAWVRFPAIRPQKKLENIFGPALKNLLAAKCAAQMAAAR